MSSAGCVAGRCSYRITAHGISVDRNSWPETTTLVAPAVGGGQTSGGVAVPGGGSTKWSQRPVRSRRPRVPLRLSRRQGEFATAVEGFGLVHDVAGHPPAPVSP